MWRARSIRATSCGLVVIALFFAPARLFAGGGDVKGIEFFEKRIRPVLIEHCYKCHSESAKKSKGGLLLDSRAAIHDGGDSGPAVIPGDVKKSILLRALRHEGPKMPDKTTQLPPAVIADFETWVKMGAPDPRDGKATARKSGIDYEEGRKHWAYQPVKAMPPPVVKATSWLRGNIDRYILARIESKGLMPAPDAAPHALLRRLSFDLIGLPPTPLEAEEFLADPSPKGIEKLVDRLLQSKQFGPHWARFWLDGVRFNDQIETVDHYRHWVVGAFNQDMPYDRFVRLQIAGGLLPSKDAREKDEHLIAAQMLYLNLREMDPIEGVIEVVGQQFLGVSLNCARCHDHKYDAYSQRDYYALAGIFTSTSLARKKTAEMRFPLANGTSIFTLAEGTVGDARLLLKGDAKQPGDIVPRRFPVVLAGDQQESLAQVTKQSGRLELANWIADANNPLTARVMVNRIWQRLMGRGIVASPNDFGTQGDVPTHPELLDHLADRFVKSGWSVKSLVREIVLAHTYQQASRSSKDVMAGDLENALWTRMPFKRQTFEQIHDNLHAVAGQLEMGPPEILAKKNAKKSSSTAVRAVYLPDPKTARIFDGADPELLVEKREASVTAPQMLFFLNNKEVISLAGEVARRAEHLAKSSDNPACVSAAYRLLFCRIPTSAELKYAEEFLQRQNFVRYCHALICTNEFVYLD